MNKKFNERKSSNIDETFLTITIRNWRYEVAKNCNLSISLLEEIRNEFLLFLSS